MGVREEATRRHCSASGFQCAAVCKTRLGIFSQRVRVYPLAVFDCFATALWLTTAKSRCVCTVPYGMSPMNLSTTRSAIVTRRSLSSRIRNTAISAQGLCRAEAPIGYGVPRIAIA